MDQISKERFDTLRKTDPANWTDADREFMTARRSYLPDEEIQFLGLEPAPEQKPYSRMNLAELHEVASAKNVVLDEDDTTKAKIIAKLEAADAAAQ